MTDLKVIIGKNFGDEGKGLAVDYFCSQSDNNLVIKHNGGAQAGHTVNLSDNSFVFHQLSSGSFRNAATFWADTYFADLFKIEEECEAFRNTPDFIPEIYCSLKTPATYIDDILINQILERSRGENRHGSCGMGINESYIRHNSGFPLYVSDFILLSEDQLINKIKYIRKYYTCRRLQALNLKDIDKECEELMCSDNILRNLIHIMKRNAFRYIKLLDDNKLLLKSFSSVIFENGQGLLLDSEYLKYAPHLTTSRTGLVNPVKISAQYGLKISEIVYVTRAYVTRHGAGPLPYECDRMALNLNEDETNKENEWQGSFRYAFHETIESFTKPVIDDLKNLKEKVNVSVFITHLNETDNQLYFIKKRDASEFIDDIRIKNLFKTAYLSNGKFAENTKMLS